MNPIVINPIGSFSIVGNLTQINKMFRASRNLLSKRSVVVRRERIAKYFNLGPIVNAGDALHQMRGWVISEIRTYVTDSQPAVGSQIVAELVRTFVKNANFFLA